jgi:protein-tyrosine kinase
MSTDYIEKAVAMLDRAHPSYRLVDSKRDVAGRIEYTNTPILELSDAYLKKNHVLTPDSDKVIMNSYKVLRTRVLQQMEQNAWSTLAVTSARPDEGKTLTAINLSISMALKLDYTVLLVDLDFRKPIVWKAACVWSRCSSIQASAGCCFCPNRTCRAIPPKFSRLPGWKSWWTN